MGRIEKAAHLYVLVPMFSVDNDQNLVTRCYVPTEGGPLNPVAVAWESNCSNCSELCPRPVRPVLVLFESDCARSRRRQRHHFRLRRCMPLRRLAGRRGWVQFLSVFHVDGGCSGGFAVPIPRIRRCITFSQPFRIGISRPLPDLSSTSASSWALRLRVACSIPLCAL